MVLCCGRRRKVRVFISLLAAFVVVSAYLTFASWKDGLRLVAGDFHHRRTADDVNTTTLLLERLPRLDTTNERHVTWFEGLRNSTKIENASENLGKSANKLAIDVTHNEGLKNFTYNGNVSKDMIGPWMSKLRPMARVGPVQNKAEFLSCKEIREIKIIKRLGNGYTKVVELGKYKGRNVAVKRVKSFVKDVVACKTRQKRKRVHECYLFANYKILKELFMLQQLQHPNIVKVLGYCVRSEQISDSLADHGVVAVTEAGSELDMEAARHMSWSKRLETAIDIASLLDYLEHSPLGSLIMADFKASQFVWVGDKVKLTDMDDVNSVEQTCREDRDCHIDNRDVGIHCARDVCRGLNAKHNMNGAFKMILERLLVHSGAQIASLREELRKLTLSAAALRAKLQQILEEERGRQRTR